jgi:hypothetical protein
MTPDPEEGQVEGDVAEGGGTLPSSPRVALFVAAAFAAGAGAALGTKAFLDSRRKGSHDEESNQDPNQDLPSVLRRAGLDVAIAATSQAVDRLGQDESAPQNAESSRQRS